MARSIVQLEHKWVLLVPKNLLYWLKPFFIHEGNVRMLVVISKLPTPLMLMHSQTIKETLLRSRNHIASGFILYPIILRHFSRPSSVCKVKFHPSESTPEEQLPSVAQCWIALAHLMRLCRHWFEKCIFANHYAKYSTCSRHLTGFYSSWPTNKRSLVKGQLRCSLETSQPWYHLQTSAFTSWRLLRTTSSASSFTSAW